MFLARRLSSPSNLKYFRSLLSSISRPNSSALFCLPSPVLKAQQNFVNPQRHFCTIRNFRSDGEYDEASTDLPVCPGCGVYMQGSDPKLPGFFTKPSKKPLEYRARIFGIPIADMSEVSNSIKKGVIQESEESMNGDLSSDAPEKPVVCARCHSLRHYGRVKDASAENLLPDFDFDHTVGRKLITASGPRCIVLMVVDAADFDGSFPRKVAKLVSTTVEENFTAWKQGKPANVPRLILVVSKIDLLPPSLSPTYLEHWVRQRAHEGGSNKITSVHLVSAVKDWGLKNLIDDVKELAGPRGNVWAVGAQNAGKSTLINAMGRSAGGKITELTEAPVPGTTLGILRVDGILSGQARLFDTPGLLHPYQISTRLTREEQKLVHISKELKPRTYRIKAGHTVHIGGLVRLDIERASVDTIYLTIWASPHLPLHMGKTENTLMMSDTHFGRQLQPPIREKRVAELGKWMKREFTVSGNSWNSSSMDVAVAGLGWFAVGLKGEAFLSVWTYDGVELTLRNSLIPQRATMFEETGFTVSKIVSRADKAVSKFQRKKKDKKEESDHNAMITNVGSVLTLNAAPKDEICQSQLKFLFIRLGMGLILLGIRETPELRSFVQEKEIGAPTM